MFLLGTQRINDAGHLEIGGCDAVELAEQYGTPLYVMDEAHVRGRMREMKREFERLAPGSEVIYASKAFICTAIARIAHQEGLMLDVASAGELHTALLAGVPPQRIVFHGNNKSLEELRMAVHAGLGRVICDNEQELESLDAVAAEAGVRQDIMLRLTPAVDPHTHRYIQTGRVDTKFGMNIIGGGARRGVEKALSMKHLDLRGLGSHIGSQILDASFFKMGATLMCQFLAEIKKDLGVTVGDLDLGGGLGIRYLEENHPPSIAEYAAMLVNTVREQCAALSLEMPRLSVEPGRSLVGEAGTTLYRVGHIKRIPEVRTFVAVDGGMSDNPRPALYEARYHAMNASHATEAERETVTISGKHCETDTLIEDVAVAPPHRDDVMAVFSTGAYNQAMGSNYNRFRRPPVVLVADGHSDIIVQRETLDDLVHNDVMPARLE